MLSLAERYRHVLGIFNNGHDVVPEEGREMKPIDALDSYYEDSLSKWAPGAAIRAINDAIEGRKTGDNETPEYLRFAPKARQIVTLYLKDANAENGNSDQDAARERMREDVASLQSRHRARNYKFSH